MERGYVEISEESLRTLVAEAENTLDAVDDDAEWHESKEAKDIRNAIEDVRKTLSFDGPAAITVDRGQHLILRCDGGSRAISASEIFRMTQTNLTVEVE